MTDPEIRLKCLELAMEQARRENVHQDREAVAKIQTWLYSLTQGNGSASTPGPSPDNAKQGAENRGRGKSGTGKSVFD